MLFPDAFFGSSTYLLFFFIGIFTVSIHAPENQAAHYSNLIAAEEHAAIRIKIRETLKPDTYDFKYIAEVEQFNREPAHGKILLLQPKPASERSYLTGEQILISGIPELIPSPLNPHQFNYSRFMRTKGVLRQIKVNPATLIHLPTERSGLFATADDWRKKITARLQNYNLGKEELAIVQALLLGQKQDISAETYNYFAAAGAVHILAVSGLHVGIILLLLNRIFSPLKRSRNGKFAATLLIILSLWGFAVLAGLSPSVVRAVTMFSFLAIGMQIKRRSSTLNSIFVSLLLLVLINPQWIFDVGFQLSYAAVLAIVLVQPIIYNFYEPQNSIIKYVWQLLTVTIAAQIGVLPLSLFYFHQFPGLFFLSNLVILPFLGFILIFGIVVIVLALLGLLPAGIAKLYEGIIEALNTFVAKVAQQEEFLLKDISFSFTEVLVFYLFIFFMVLWLYSFNYKRLVLLLLSVVVLQTVMISQKFSREEIFLVFHKSRKTVLAKQYDNVLTVHSTSEAANAKSRLLHNYMVGEDIKNITFQELKNVVNIQNEMLLIIDSTGVYPKQNFNPEYLLLINSPPINLDRVIQQLKPKWILADGSNYKSMVQQWEQTSAKKEIPFHYTGEKGAFILK